MAALEIDILANIIGIIGVILIVLAYFLNQVEKLSNQDMSYQLLNLGGALMILFSLYFHWNLASFIIEIVWIAISLYGIAKIIKNKQ